MAKSQLFGPGAYVWLNGATTQVTSVADAALAGGTALGIAGVENQPLHDVPLATFVDSNPFATPADFSAIINWGDGTPTDANARVALVGGSATGAIFAVYGSHAYAAAGGFAATVNVLDKGGSSLAITPMNG